jgi:hypothetical protein
MTSTQPVVGIRTAFMAASIGGLPAARRTAARRRHPEARIWCLARNRLTSVVLTRGTTTMTAWPSCTVRVVSSTACGHVCPFIEAEKSQRRNGKRACVLLKVSRAAFYADRTAGPSQRERDDAELTEAILAVHEESDGASLTQRPG